MAFLDKTRAAGEYVIKDVQKLIHRTTIIMQIIFLGLYGYSIYNNLNHVSILIPYIILAVISLVSFVFYMASYSNKKDFKVKFTKKIFKNLIDVDKVVMLTINIVEFVVIGGTKIGLLLLVFSGISVLFKLLFRVVEKLVSDYIDRLHYAWNKDVEESWLLELAVKPDKLGTIQSRFLGAVGSTLEKFKKDDKESLEVKQFKKLSLEEKRKIKDEKKLSSSVKDFEQSQQDKFIDAKIEHLKKSEEGKNKIRAFFGFKKK